MVFYTISLWIYYLHHISIELGVWHRNRGVIIKLEHLYSTYLEVKIG